METVEDLYAEIRYTNWTDFQRNRQFTPSTIVVSTMITPSPFYDVLKHGTGVILRYL